MTRFRNVDFDPASPPDEWPGEAIETALDRGSLADWRKLAAAIRRNPWGPAARAVESIVGWQEHYGVDALMSRVIERARADADRRGRVAYAERIRAWRRQAGLTQGELARLAGTSASRLSDYENAKVAPTTDVLGRIEQVAAAHTRGRRPVGGPAPTAVPSARAGARRQARSG